MVDITQEQVADALHLDSITDLPTGVSSDIESAEAIVGEQVEPYADNQTLVEKTAVYVACSFITTTEGDFPVSSMTRETATLKFDTDVGAPRDFWSRAQAFDPTGRLGRDTVGFEAY